MQSDIFQANLAGVVNAGDGRKEAALLYLYLKGMKHAESTTFRGFMFLESADHEWYNWGGTGLCMPQVAMGWLPRIFFRSAHAPIVCFLCHRVRHHWNKIDTDCERYYWEGTGLCMAQFAPKDALQVNKVCAPHTEFLWVLLGHQLNRESTHRWLRAKSASMTAAHPATASLMQSGAPLAC